MDRDPKFVMKTSKKIWLRYKRVQAHHHHHTHSHLLSLQFLLLLLLLQANSKAFTILKVFASSSAFLFP